MLKPLAVILLALSTVGVNAASLRGSPENCPHFANVMTDAGERRDAGLPYETAFQIYESGAREAVGLPGSILQSEEDVQYVLDVLKRLYEPPMLDVHGHDLRILLLYECLNVKLK